MSTAGDIKKLPTEMPTEFQNDIASIILAAEDRTDEIIFHATKEAIETFVRGELKPEELDSLYQSLLDLYKKEKKGEPNKELLAQTDYFLAHAKQFKKGLDEKTGYYTA
jgi:hypothetical protein